MDGQGIDPPARRTTGEKGDETDELDGAGLRAVHMKYSTDEVHVAC